MAAILQLNVGQTYDQFLNLVARGRDMAPETVEELAQGRVWTGARAQALGLVDQLGGLEEAIELAAELAGLDEDYGIERLRPQLSARDLLLSSLSDIRSGLVEHPLWRELANAEAFIRSLNDPRSAYAICEICLGRGVGREP